MPNNTTSRRRRRPIPLTQQAPIMKSRKRARHVTTTFHKLTKSRDLAEQQGDEQAVQEYEQQLQDLGGRKAYQQASQLSTTHFSTTKGWVWKDLMKKYKQQNQPLEILEVGAINTDLIDLASAWNQKQHNKEQQQQQQQKRIIRVRAIDIRSSHPSIEQLDFFDLPLDQTFDVIVCSMVINCVTTPQARGKMLLKLVQHLNIDERGGLLYLALPKFCLTQSAFLTMNRFQELLDHVGLDVVSPPQTHTPKIAFFVCRRRQGNNMALLLSSNKWKKAPVLNKGKKFPNQFSIVLDPADVESLLLSSSQGAKQDSLASQR